MEKNYKKIVLIAVILICMSGIIREQIRPKELGFRLHISSDEKQKIDIPDPSTANGITDVIIHPIKRLYNDENPKNTQMVNLSYLGLKEKVYVIKYVKGRYKNSKRDDYLALVLGTKKDENAYFAILDYKNKKSYMIKTGQVADNVDQINKCDLTGDDKEEWIVSGVANKWIEWNAYRLLDGELKEIRCNYAVCDEEDKGKETQNFVQDAFREKYVSYDKVEVSCKDANFKKIINVKGAPYLDYKEAMLDDVIAFGDEVEYDCFMKIDKKQGICYPLVLEIGHGSICAEINAYLKYDKKIDMIKVYKVNIKEVHY